MSQSRSEPNLYDVALAVTDEVCGDGAYAQINAGNPNPGVQAAIKRWLLLPREGGTDGDR
jgi:hypothetical protein